MSNLYTASQIAVALGRKRQVIQRLLLNTPASGQTVVNGNMANVWSIEALPAGLREQLQAEAGRRHYRTAEDLLAHPPTRWEPSIPLVQIAQHCLDKAAKLMRALAPSIRRQDDMALSQAQFEALGVEDYKRQFGHSISTRHFRDLFRRTIERDGGAEEWDRLEIYLDQDLARKPEAAPIDNLEAEMEFQELRKVISAFKNPTQPEESEELYLWVRAFELMEERIEQGRNAKKARIQLLKFLQRNAPFLAASPSSLRVVLRQKYERWIDGDRQIQALKDGRKLKPKTAPLSPEDRDALIGKAVLECGGRVSQAWREAIENEELSEEVRSRYLANPASLSYVPQRIRDEVKHEVAMMENIHHGPREHKLKGAYISRDWSGVHAGDWYQADDCTLPVYFYEPDGNGWFNLVRGQCLVMIDLRSWKILGFSLQPDKNYNSRVIRTLIHKVCDKNGLPRKGFYFEGGIWESSKLLKGQATTEVYAIRSDEVELGLREHGLRFIHARTPRAKPVERVLGAVQDLMEAQPGYIGRDEIHEKFERVRQQMLDVQGRRVHPSKHFLSFEQWIERLDEIFSKYNERPQGGKMLLGMAPDEAFEKLDDPSNPPIKLDASIRYLFALHRRPVRVTGNGIKFRIGKQDYIYRGKETSDLIGQTVLAWFDPEFPEILTITDMNRQNPRAVPRSHDVPAMDATPEEMEREMSLINGHLGYARVRYKTLRAPFDRKFRRNLVDRETAELGQQIDQQKADLRAQMAKKENQVTKARGEARKLNLTLPPSALRRPEVAAEGAANLRRLLEEAKAEESDE